MSIDYAQLTAPNLRLIDIADAAHKFRQQYWGQKPSPIKILDILEFDLKIRIIPVPKLEADCNTHCFITSDWKHILIDRKQYENEVYDKRTNFSVAHEIGHQALHKKFYESLQITSLEEFYEFFLKIPGFEYDRLEKQCHAFAGRVLVPREELIREIQEIIKQSRESEMGKILQGRFDVTSEVIIRRIQSERLMPLFESIDTDFAL